MDKQQFQNILTIIDQEITQCNELIYKTKEEIENAPLKELVERKAKILPLKQRMDVVLNTELYHLLGMGKFTASQCSIFTKKIKQYMELRPYLQRMASLAVDSVQIPNMAKNTKYTCEVLNVKLKGGNE